MRRYSYNFHYIISDSGVKHVIGEIDGIQFGFPSCFGRSNAIQRILSTGCTHQDAEDCYLEYTELRDADRIPVTGFSEYKTYLDDEHWAKTRKKIMARDGYRCQICGSKRDLQVHHLTYKNIGQETDEQLVCLCRQCHFGLHEGSVSWTF